MANINYKVLEPVSGNLESLSSKLSNLVESCESYPNSVDPKLHEYYSDYFQGIFSSKGEISNDGTNMTSFGQWFEGLIAEGNATDQANAQSVPTGGTSSGGGGGGNGDSGNGAKKNVTAGDEATRATTSSTSGDGANNNTTAETGATGATTTTTGGEGTSSTTTSGTGATGATTTTTTGDGSSRSTTAGDGATGATTTTTTGEGSTKPSGSVGGALATSVGGTTGEGAKGMTGAAAGAGGALAGFGAVAGAALTKAGEASEDTKGATVKITEGDGISDVIESSMLGLDGTAERINKDFAHYGFSEEEWNKLTPEAQEAIKAKLKSLGYSDEEIENIINGNLKVVGCVQDAVATKLEQLLKQDPTLRQKLLEQYGIDVFNPDGTIDRSKLTLAMLMDERDPSDSYSLINYLHDNYGIDLISGDRMNLAMEKLLKAYKKNPKFRTTLKQKYGIDIFNPDGTINYERLTKLLLMDDVDPNDAYELNKFLEEYNKQNSIFSGFKSFFGGGPLSILGAGTVLATSSILMYMMIKKSKNKPPIDTTGKYMYDDDYYNISQEDLELLGDELDKLEMKLIDVSYNYDEVDKFKAGQYSVLKCLMEEIQSALEILIIDNKKLEKDLVNIYDFNIFDKGVISQTKLATLLVIDFKDNLDRYDIIKLLKDDYDMEVAIDKKLKEVTDKLKEDGTELLDENGEEVEINESNMKNILKKQYKAENEVS